MAAVTYSDVAAKDAYNTLLQHLKKKQLHNM